MDCRCSATGVCAGDCVVFYLFSAKEAGTTRNSGPGSGGTMAAERIIYIKAEESKIVTHTKVCLEDVLRMTSPEQKVVKELGKQVLFVVPEEKKNKYVFSILKVIEFIQKQHPDYQVVNEGELDFIVEYMPPAKQERWAEVLKILFVCLAVSIGSAFTIMTFNQDASVTEIFSRIYTVLEGEENTGPGLLELFYCIGLPLGIIVFFDHFSKLKLSNDPTPLQVQLRLYEQDVNTAIMKEASREGKSIDV